MCTEIEDLLGGICDAAARLDVSRLSGAAALALLESYAQTERVIGAARARIAGRVRETGAWRTTGSSSAVAHLGEVMGSSMHQAAASLTTVERLDEMPFLREAFVTGRLSGDQAAEIAVAAAADPAAEADLVDLAERESLATLREKCRDVVAAVAGDEGASERIRRGRFFRHRVDRDGAVRLDARLAPEDAAPLIAGVRIRAEELLMQARRSGDGIESLDAYAADALVSLAGGDTAGSAVVHIHVSATAWERGHTVAGETCRIEGVAPIGVNVARRMASSGVVKVLETEGVDVTRVAHAGRVVPAHVRTALEARDPTCAVPKCNRRLGLEIDHLTPVVLGGKTELANLARLCRWHHAQKTHHGWRLEGSPGHWRWTRGGAGGDRSPPDRGG